MGISILFLMSTIGIIANGEFTPIPELMEKIRSHDLLIAVDGGLNICMLCKFKPPIIIGDMDSVTNEAIAAFPNIEKLTFPPDKDQTDIELAIEYALSQQPTNIVLYAVTGFRLDHSLSNMLFLSRHRGILSIETHQETLFCLTNSKTTIETLPGQTLSFVPLNGPAKGITTHGLKWELENRILDKSFMSLSNEAVGNRIEITYESGDLLCILNK